MCIRDRFYSLVHKNFIYTISLPLNSREKLSPSDSFNVAYHQFSILVLLRGYLNPKEVTSVSGSMENIETCWPAKHDIAELFNNGRRIPVSVTIITFTLLTYSVSSEMFPSV